MTAANNPSTSGDGEEPSRVLYIGHLPHGFYEDQLKGFFTQFGKVTKVRVSRNKKTGKAKHYAFLEFQLPDVAAIAAEAMDGYMMFTQKLVVRVVPTKDVHQDLWKGANRKFDTIPWRKIEKERHNAERTPEQQQARLERAVRRDKQRQKRILQSGIDYNYEPLEAAVLQQAKREKLDDASKAKEAEASEPAPNVVSKAPEAADGSAPKVQSEALKAADGSALKAEKAGDGTVSKKAKRSAADEGREAKRPKGSKAVDGSAAKQATSAEADEKPAPMPAKRSNVAVNAPGGKLKRTKVAGDSAAKEPSDAAAEKKSAAKTKKGSGAAAEAPEELKHPNVKTGEGPAAKKGKQAKAEADTDKKMGRRSKK